MASVLDKSYGLITSAARLSQESSAKALAAKLASDEGLNKSFNTAIAAARANQESAHLVLFSLLNAMEVDPDTLECDEMDAWPVPGSMKKDVGDNEPFDRYEYKDPTSGNVKKDSYYGRMAKEHPIGAAILARKEQIETDKENGKISEGDAARKKSDVDRDFTTFSSKLRLAVACYFHMKAMRKAFPKSVVVDFSKTLDKDGETILDKSSPKIIEVSNKVKRGVAKYFTIANFLKLDIKKAVAAGGAYEDVITSNKREQEQQAGVNEEKHVKVQTNADFEDATIAVVNYIDHKFSSTVNQKDILAFYRGAGSDARLQTLFDLEDKITKLTGIKDLRDRYEALIAGTDDGKKKAA